MKKVLSFFLLFLILFTIGTMYWQTSAIAFENAGDEKKPSIDFDVDGGNLYFFDRSNNTVYIYSSRGEFRRAYKLETPGLRMQTISATEIREKMKN